MKKNRPHVLCSLCLGAVIVAASIVSPALSATTPETARPHPTDGLFDTFIDRLMAVSHISGLACGVVVNDSLVWSTGYGLTNREAMIEASPDTIFLVASISKTITATAVMQCYEQGLFDLEDDISAYLPFTLRNPMYPEDPITIRQLLGQHSSLGRDNIIAGVRLLPASIHPDGYPVPFFEDLLLPGGPLYIPTIWSAERPGQQMNYSNFGFGLLGYLVEELTGERFDEYCRAHVFEPLGMLNTSFSFDDLPADRIACPYVYDDGKYQRYIHFTILDYPCGGLRTTIADLSHFLIAHLNGGMYREVRLLSAQNTSLMHEIQFENSTGNTFQYGLGFQIWEDATGTWVGHTGDLPGVASYMAFRNGESCGAMFFCNKKVVTLRDRVAFMTLIACMQSKAHRLAGIPLAPTGAFSDMSVPV